MVFANLFPLGVLQLGDAVANGYWHARSIDSSTTSPLIEWLRLPGDVLFIAAASCRCCGYVGSACATAPATKS